MSRYLAVLAVLALVGCKQAQPRKPGGDLFYADQMKAQPDKCPDDMQTILPSKREMREKDAIYHLTTCQPDSLHAKTVTGTIETHGANSPVIVGGRP